MKGELCLAEKSEMALVRSLSNSSSSSHSVKPLNSHWSLRRDSTGVGEADLDISPSDEMTDSASSGGFEAYISFSLDRSGADIDEMTGLDISTVAILLCCLNKLQMANGVI